MNNIERLTQEALENSRVPMSAVGYLISASRTARRAAAEMEEAEEMKQLSEDYLQAAKHLLHLVATGAI